MVRRCGRSSPAKPFRGVSIRLNRIVWAKACRYNGRAKLDQENGGMAVGGAFPDKALISRLTAKMLLEVEAIHFNADKPFIFTSGWASPVYSDCSKLISFPLLRQTMIDI